MDGGEGGELETDSSFPMGWGNKEGHRREGAEDKRRQIMLLVEKKSQFSRGRGGGVRKRGSEYGKGKKGPEKRETDMSGRRTEKKKKPQKGKNCLRVGDGKEKCRFGWV